MRLRSILQLLELIRGQRIMSERRNSKSFRDRKVPNFVPKAQNEMHTNTNSFPVRPQMFVIRTKRISSLADREKVLNAWNLNKNDVSQQIGDFIKLQKEGKNNLAQKDGNIEVGKIKEDKKIDESRIHLPSDKSAGNVAAFHKIRESALEAELLDLCKEGVRKELWESKEQEEKPVKAFGSSLEKKITDTISQNNFYSQKKEERPPMSFNSAKQNISTKKTLDVVKKDTVMLELGKKISVKGFIKKKKRMNTKQAASNEPPLMKQHEMKRKQLEKISLENLNNISETMSKNNESLLLEKSFESEGLEQNLCESILINQSQLGKYTDKLISSESNNKLNSHNLVTNSVKDSKFSAANKENKKRKYQFGEGTKRSVSIRSKSRTKKINECKLRRINWGGGSTHKNIFDPQLSAIHHNDSNKQEQPLESLKELFDQMI